MMVVTIGFFVVGATGLWAMLTSPTRADAILWALPTLFAFALGVTMVANGVWR